MSRKHLFLLLPLLLFPLTSHALSTDKGKPMTIEADSVEIDEKKGLTVYRGNVDVRQGTLHVTGSTLVIEKVNGEVKIVTVIGKPAAYRQRPDNKKQDVTAKARKLQLYPKRDLVRLERDARIVQEGNVYTGNIIEYDNKKDIIKMKGNIGATDTGKKAKGLSDVQRREYQGNALHDNCKGCHKEFNKEHQADIITGKREKAPFTCNECHPERKRK
jgi:lipopolysaccharide export system protein LptA